MDGWRILGIFDGGGVVGGWLLVWWVVVVVVGDFVDVCC